MNGCQRIGALLVCSAACLFSAQQKVRIRHVAPENVSAAHGPEMFRAYCAVCHGADGRGGGPAADSLTKRPADLTQLSRRADGKFPSHRVVNIIQGSDVVAAHGSRDMPIWGSVFRTLGDSATVKIRIDNLTAYLQSLQRQ